MNDISNYFDDFSAIRKANEMISRFTPVFEAIDSFRKRGSFTVREIGEYMIGDEYHQKHAVRVWRETKEVRTTEAMSLTALITSAVRKMVKSGAVSKSEVKDTSHPYTVEVDGYYYCDKNGKVLPNTTIVTMPDGSEYEVETKNLRGVRRAKGIHTETKYNTYSMYTFTD